VSSAVTLMDCFNLFTLEETLTGHDRPVCLLNSLFFSTLIVGDNKLMDFNLTWYIHVHRVNTRRLQLHQSLVSVF